MASNWWANNPLPPGWESKWDPGQKRYFFIDHSTKKTSWVDPRSPEGRHLVTQRPPQPPQAPYGAGGGGGGYPMQSLGTVCKNCRFGRVPSNSRDQLCSSCQVVKCNLCDKNKVNKQGDVCTQCMERERAVQETSFNDVVAVTPLFVVADELLVKKLKESYPKAFESHIRAALESADNDLTSASQDLERRGYKKLSQLEVKTEEMFQTLRPKYRDCGEELLRTTIMGCKADLSRTLRKMKELGFLTPEEKIYKEKQDRLAKANQELTARNLRRDFPNLSADVITLALESSHYDDPKARALLTSIANEETERARTPVASKLGASANVASTAAPRPSISQQSAPRPSTSQQTQPKTTQPKQTQPKQTVPKKVTSRQPEQRQRSAIKSVKPASPKSKLANGPDPSLPKGGQDSLLLTTYCEVQGPNAELVHGPTCIVKGSQGAVGSDISLVRGPAINARYQQRLLMARI